MRNSTWPAWWELGRRPGQEAIRGCETKQLSFASTNSNWACLLVFATPIGWSCAFMADVCACFLAEFSGLMRKLFRTGRLFSLCVVQGFPGATSLAACFSWEPAPGASYNDLELDASSTTNYPGEKHGSSTTANAGTKSAARAVLRCLSTATALER
jgi:hypothetical protein